MRLKLAQKFSESGYDITPEEWVILNRLWQKEGRSQNELAETTIKDKTTVTRFLNRMEKKGLVVRQNSSEDARVKHVYLTAYGKELETVLIPIAEALLSAGVANIDKGDVDKAFTVLKKIEQNLLHFE
ncbi:MAG: MarR family winged helix-turn-helix transcriptional regulator [Chloroflexota bacterium]